MHVLLMAMEGLGPPWLGFRTSQRCVDGLDEQAPNVPDRLTTPCHDPTTNAVGMWKTACSAAPPHTCNYLSPANSQANMLTHT